MTADPMLPVGQKMRRTADGHETEVLASGEDWAIIRPERWAKALRPVANSSSFVVEMARPERRWEPVTEPTTWDVRHDEGDKLLFVEPSARPGGWAVYIDPERLPDPSIADDFAHYIARLIELWEPGEYPPVAVAQHRAAQTEREQT